MTLEEAEAFLERCRAATGAAAAYAVRGALEEIRGKGYATAGGCVLLGSGRNDRSEDHSWIASALAYGGRTVLPRGSYGRVHRLYGGIPGQGKEAAGLVAKVPFCP